MNLPNKLTVFRVILIPFFVALFLIKSIPLNFLFALIVFALASFTDMLDGKIARKHGLITDFGKLMDPLADKLLVCSALILLLNNSYIETISLILIISREFLVTSIRLLAAQKGQVLAADIYGKLKTVFQMVFICVALLKYSVLYNFGLTGRFADVVSVTSSVLFYIMLALTLISGANYCIKNAGLLSER